MTRTCPGYSCRSRGSVFVAKDLQAGHSKSPNSTMVTGASWDPKATGASIMRFQSSSSTVATERSDGGGGVVSSSRRIKRPATTIAEMTRGTASTFSNVVGVVPMLGSVRVALTRASAFNDIFGWKWELHNCGLTQSSGCRPSEVSLTCLRVFLPARTEPEAPAILAAPAGMAGIAAARVPRNRL